MSAPPFIWTRGNGSEWAVHGALKAIITRYPTDDAGLVGVGVRIVCSASDEERDATPAYRQFSEADVEGEIARLKQILERDLITRAAEAPSSTRSDGAAHGSGDPLAKLALESPGFYLVQRAGRRIR